MMEPIEITFAILNIIAIVLIPIIAVVVEQKLAALTNEFA